MASGLSDMSRSQLFRTGQIGSGPCDPRQPVNRPS
jgi:hypothetical protein